MEENEKGMRIDDPPQRTEAELEEAKTLQVEAFLLKEEEMRAEIRHLNSCIEEATRDHAKLRNERDVAQEAYLELVNQRLEEGVAKDMQVFDAQRDLSEVTLRYEWATGVNHDFDYRYLLYLFLRHVGELEGTNFVAFQDKPKFMSDGQWEELERLAGMA